MQNLLRRLINPIKHKDALHHVNLSEEAKGLAQGVPKPPLSPKREQSCEFSPNQPKEVFQDHQKSLEAASLMGTRKAAAPQTIPKIAPYYIPEEQEED